MNEYSVYLPPHCFCPKGHDLNWSDRSLEVDLCSICDLNGNSEKPKNARYDCLECNQTYCLKCRKPLIIDGVCPLGHVFKEKELSANCEICEKKINSKGFRDFECGFVICQKCMEICGSEPSDFFKNFSKEKIPPSKIAFDLLDFKPTCYKVRITVSNYDNEEESKNDAKKNKFFMNPFCNPPINNIKLLGQVETKNAAENEIHTLLLSEPKNRLRNFWAEIWLSSGRFSLHNVENNDCHPMGVKVRKHRIKTKDEFKIGEIFMKAYKNKKTNNLSLKFYSKFSMDAEDWVGEIVLKPENEETFIGKNYNDFLGNIEGISKQHAKIIYEYGDYIIFDIRSKSGLFLLVPKQEQENIFDNFDENEEKNISYLLLGKKTWKIEVKPVTNFQWPICNNDHVLEWIEGNNEVCSNCAEKDKTHLIYWFCPICKKHFCNHCKSPAVFKNKRCSFYHKLTLESFRGKKRPVGRRLCRLCDNQLEESYWDAKCNYEICSECRDKKKKKK